MAYAAVAAGARERLMTCFTDADGRAREVLALADEGSGRVTVFDRSADGDQGRRLIGVLAAEEPRSNAALLAELFVADAAIRSLRCADFDGSAPRSRPDRCAADAPRALRDGDGRVWRLTRVAGATRLPEMRWRDDASAVVSVRDVVAAMQSYAPVCDATEAALALSGVSTAVLRAELERVRESPILLNRCLRERVAAEVGAARSSMGEIAARCGRTKRDGAGTRSGDTSWLARRVGLLAETRRARPTPWVHTEVLALIARTGLGVSPREVETP